MGLESAWPGTAGDAGDGQELNWWVEAFKDEMWHLAQQKGSKLRDKVRTRTVTGDATYFERLAPSDPVLKAARHTATPVLDLTHSRRKVTMKDWLWADLVDAEDKRRMLVDPVSAYSTNAGMSMGRKWDDLIIGSDGAATPAISEGILGNAYDGTGTIVAFDTTNQQIASGSAGLTISKLTEAKYIMDNNDVDPMDRCLVIGPKQLQDLLNTTEVTSSDYNTVKALVKGEVSTFLGFDIVVSTRLPLATAERVCVAFQKNCVGLAVNKDVEIRRDEREDLSYALQVFASFTANATRIDDAGVVSILCVEA
jgi:hypothetical protein